MITQMKFGYIPSMGSYFTPFRIFQPSMTHIKPPESSSTFMIFRNKFSFPLPTLSSTKPCVLAGKNLFFCRFINNIYKDYKVIVTPGKHRDLIRLLDYSTV